jgi:hypothetical protein
MLRGRVAGGSGACYALRRDGADDAPGAAQPATVFVTDWTPSGSRAATFDLRAVMRELVRGSAIAALSCAGRALRLFCA